MVNNQTEFNNEFSKETKEIEIKNEDFQDSLIIENYPKLKDLYLYNISSIDKLTLKNLPQLQNCTIQNCDTIELIIDNCLQIENLNIQTNFLTSLEFLANLNNLKELKFDGNPKLTEILKPYQNNWKLCQKNIQELSKVIRENPRALSNLQEKYAGLKDFLKEVWFSISEETQEKLMNKLENEIENKQQIILNNTSREPKTVEIVLGVKKSLESTKELKQELSKLRREKEKLEAGLIKEKEQQLEKLKDEFVEKKLGFFGNVGGNKREKIKNKLTIYLSSAKWKQGDEGLKLVEEEVKGWLLKGERRDSELANLLKELRGKQISLLEVKGEVIKKVKSKEIIDIVYDLEKAKVEEVIPDVILRKEVSNPSDADAKQSEKYTYKKSKTRTWNNSFGVEMGVNISVATGIPTLAEVGFVLKPKLIYTGQQGGLESEESTIESASEFNVPANSRGIVIISARRVKTRVPFKYIELITYDDGQIEEVIKSGTYESVESFHDIKVDLKTEKIVEQTKAQQEVLLK